MREEASHCGMTATSRRVSQSALFTLICSCLVIASHDFTFRFVSAHATVLRYPISPWTRKI